MKKIIAVLLALTFILSFSACVKKDSDKKEENSTKNEAVSKDEEKVELKDITVCLDWTPNTNHTGLYVAAEKGYYKDAGLNVTIVQPPEDGAVLMCASGQAQFAVAYQDTIVPSYTQDDPLEVTAVAALVQHNTSGIITRKGEGADRPKGLEGMQYSTWESPIELATIKAVMEKDGGDYSKLKLIPNNITDEAGALKHKDTDAIWIFYGWGGVNAKLQGLDFDFFYFKDLDPVFDYYSPTLISNDAFLESDPETAKAFLEATKKGYEYSIENPEEAAKILVDSDTTGSLRDSIELVTESQKWISKEYIADAEKWGVIDAERWDGFYSWLWDNELIEKQLPAGMGFTNDYLS